MAYENLCMYCFKDMNGEVVCPHCGGDSQAAVPQIQLLPGTLVYNQRFLVGRALGQDSGGIVYNALDTKRGGVIRIREYLPRNCAERLNDGSVVPIAGMEDTFDTGMRKLHASVDSVEDPRQRHFYFEENGTAYIAQRKNVAPAPNPYEEEEDDDEASRRRTFLYIAIAAAVVLAVAVVAILFFNSLGAPDDQTVVSPLNSPSNSESATWTPLGTPSPSPTSTFSSLVDPELNWLEFTKPTATAGLRTAAPTQPPTVQGDQNYPTINTGSSAESIRALQNRLVQLGWLTSNDVTGKYDDTTRAAVRAFQQFVNDACSPAEKLAVDGIAGQKTQQWLYNASVSLTKPTATPTPKITAAPDDGAVDANSSASAIRALQNQLISLGLLPTGSADGRYGTATQAAVRSFQRRVNELQGYTVLSETGKADALTRAWLNFYVQDWEQHKPTATPKPKITPTPNPNIDASSPKERIREVQKLLQQVGLLSANDADGVYGSRTKEAVRKFQTWVNQMRGTKTLEVSGVVDPLTLRYMNYCVENGYMYELNTNPPATNAPTFEPGPEVTEVPPGYQAGEDGITPDSKPETIEFMQEMLRDIGLMDDSQISGSYDEASRQAVRAFQQAVNEIYGEEVLPVNGNCDANTLAYLQEAYDFGWNLGDSGDVPDEPIEEPTEEPTQAPSPEPEKPVDGIVPGSPTGEILAMQRMLRRTGLLDEAQVSGEYDAATEEAVRNLQLAINIYNKRDVVEVTGYCDTNTLEYLRYADEHNMNLRDLLNQNTPTPVPTEAPSAEPTEEATPEPTDVPTPEPTEAPTPEPTEEPRVGTITALRFYLSGQEVSGRVELEHGSYELSWAAEGELQSYSVYLYDGGGNLKNSAENSAMTSFKIKAGDMNPGEVYELRVGALPVNGTSGDIYWQSLTLTRPVAVTPEPTEAPTPAPSVSKPVIKIGGTTRDVNGIPYVSDETIIFSWKADGQVQSYTVNLYDEFGNLSSLGETVETSRTVRRDQLSPGIYHLHVGAKPVGGGEDSIVWNELAFGIPEPEATPEPQPEITPEPAQPDAPRITYVDANSSADDIQKVQMALYGHGLLNATSVTPGTLDAVTLEAVAAFQRRVNEQYGLDLYVIDPTIDAYIDEQTLDLLLYQEIDLSL